MELTRQEIETAVVPTDSQQKFAFKSNYFCSHSVTIRPFGDDVFCWFVNYELMFYSPGKRSNFPITAIPDTRLMLGMEACFEDRTIVLMHHDYPENDTYDAVIKFDFYSVDKDYNVSLVRTVSTLAECRANNLTFHFSSPKIGEYIGLFADFFNYEFFKTLQVSIRSDTEVSVEAGRTDFESCVLPLGDWGDYAQDHIFPGLGCLYNPDVYPVLKHHDCVSLIIRKVLLHPRNAPKARVFTSTVRLPVAVHHVNTRSDYERASAMVMKINQMLQHADGTDRALVHINTDHDQCVYLLLHMQNNTVLDMYMCQHEYDQQCIIDKTGDRMVRFVGPDKKVGEKKVGEKKVGKKEENKEEKVEKKSEKKDTTEAEAAEEGVKTRGMKRKQG